MGRCTFFKLPCKCEFRHINEGILFVSFFLILKMGCEFGQGYPREIILRIYEKCIRCEPAVIAVNQGMDLSSNRVNKTGRPMKQELTGLYACMVILSIWGGGGMRELSNRSSFPPLLVHCMQLGVRCVGVDL